MGEHVDGASIVKAATIKSVGAFFVAVVITVGVIVMAAIISKGTYGVGQVCPDNGGTAATIQKMADTDVQMDVQLMDNGQMKQQPVTFDYDENTVLVETPANVSGITQAATIAIDYARSVIVINVHEENICMASALRESIATDVSNFMKGSREQVIDLATARLTQDNYDVIGEIPAGYVQNSNGPIIRGLCSGRSTNWSEMRTSTVSRRKRKIGFFKRLHVKFCFFKCVEIRAEAGIHIG